jgi:hypothetical protein
MNPARVLLCYVCVFFCLSVSVRESKLGWGVKFYAHTLVSASGFLEYGFLTDLPVNEEIRSDEHRYPSNHRC